MATYSSSSLLRSLGSISRRTLATAVVVGAAGLVPAIAEAGASGSVRVTIRIVDPSSNLKSVNGPGDAGTSAELTQSYDRAIGELGQRLEATGVDAERAVERLRGDAVVVAGDQALVSGDTDRAHVTSEAGRPGSVISL